MIYSLAMVNECAAFLQQKGIDKPIAGIVLGIGLGVLINKIDIRVAVPYKDIPNFPEAKVEFHKGNLIYGFLNEVLVLAMQGRFHYYEGYSMQQITFPIRVMNAILIIYSL